MGVSAVDLFCGAGGLTRGLESAGINVKLGIDNDPSCQYPYEKNNNANFLKKSVDKVKASDFDHFVKKNDIFLLAGCAPCQTFSSYNKKANAEDERWWLLLEFARLIEESRPELVTMENVPGLIEQAVFVNFVGVLNGLGYEVTHTVVNCVEYGLPQNRKRLVLLASKLGKPEIISPESYRKILGPGKNTVREAISHLPVLESGKIDSSDALHQSARLSEINLKRIQASRPNGTWRDWPEALVAKCHRNSTGKGYGSVYGRMSMDAAAPTITTQFYGYGSGRFGHPDQDRALSLREGAILQGFPDDYEFVEPGKPIARKVVGRLIGNAVPVNLGILIGKSLKLHVEQVHDQEI